MKRTATTLAFLAGLGGGCVGPNGTSSSRQTRPADAANTPAFGRVTTPAAVPGVVGPTGEPITAGVRPAGFTAAGASGVQLVGSGCKDCGAGGHAGIGGFGHGGFGHGGSEQGIGGPSGGYPPHRMNNGVLPVPGMGPPGAVAAVGAMPVVAPAMPSGQRTSIRFVSPASMRITWQQGNGTFSPEGNALTTPAAYNFAQGSIYRLRLTGILPNYPGKVFYPTLEVVNANPKTVKFLAHSTVPVSFTNEDFDQAAAGNMVVKVIYLPDREFADFATVAGAAEEIVSTRLDPASDPVAEAQKRGTVLAIITLGNIDLENQFSPAMNQPPAFGGPMMAPPGLMAPGMVPPGLMAPPAVAPPAVAPPAVAPPIAPVPPVFPGQASAPVPTTPSAPGTASVKMTGSVKPPTMSAAPANPSFLPTLTR